MLRFSLLACLTCLVAALGFACADPITLAVTSDGQFGSLDLGTGDFTRVGDAYAGLFDGLGMLADGTLVSVDAVNNLFVQIDPATGAVAPIGPTGITVTVMASMPTGDPFAIDDQNQLHWIDPTTGAATLVGPTGLPGIELNNFANALAGDGSTLYYIYEQGSPAPVPSILYQLDLATGTATAIGPTGTTSLVGAGFVGGVLYAYSAGDGVNEIFTIDVTTGAATRGAPYSADFLIYGSNLGILTP